MPELPEVEITRLKLAPIVGKTIVNFWTDIPKKIVSNFSVPELQEDIQQYTISKLTRTGKVLFINLAHPDKTAKILAFHQRMSGRFKIMEKEEVPTKHTHAILTFSDHTQLHFIDPRKFGIIWYGTSLFLNQTIYLKNLGSDALSVSYKDFLKRVKKYSGMIKPLLLRQDMVAGIGNIVVDETLWESRIHPQTRLSNISDQQFKTIHTSLQNVLKKSIAAKGSTLRDWKHPDGETGGFTNYMQVYGRKGEKCVRCQTLIIRTVVGSRGTWICPICQQIS